jgi:hypothetical protein
LGFGKRELRGFPLKFSEGDGFRAVGEIDLYNGCDNYFFTALRYGAGGNNSRVNIAGCSPVYGKARTGRVG